MTLRKQGVLAALALGFLAARETIAGGGTVVFETTSVYHHIRVVEAGEYRSLLFDSSEQSRIALADPEAGRFEYIDYFFMPWLWNVAMTNVLMIGLGGGSAQQAYARYCPGVTVETVELDPAVLKVAEDYFGFRQSPRQRVVISDGRMFLQRSRRQYDAVLVDAYVEGRYGASIPYHLATQEFFRLVSDRLATNGVVAYNCIGVLQNDKADLVGALHRTMKSVFSQVYLFPARESWNVVLVGTRDAEAKKAHELWPNAMPAWQSGRLRLPTFFQRLGVFRVAPPASSLNSPLLADDYAPVDGLLGGMRPLAPQLRRQTAAPR
ncbi:MAG TPA: fused MFS/spermidine synthase [Verrucomicrobiota bacterium]|nr:fused MFS/spermidine synthase [Verrucomicrobiota bacterium]